MTAPARELEADCPLCPGLLALVAGVMVCGTCGERFGQGAPAESEEPNCSKCKGSGWVCEGHRSKAFNQGDGCACGAAGVRCDCIEDEAPPVSPFRIA